MPFETLEPQSRFGAKLLEIRVNLSPKRRCGSEKVKPCLRLIRLDRHGFFLCEVVGCFLHKHQQKKEIGTLYIFMFPDVSRKELSLPYQNVFTFTFSSAATQFTVKIHGKVRWHIQR